MKLAKLGGVQLTLLQSCFTSVDWLLYLIFIYIYIYILLWSLSRLMLHSFQGFCIIVGVLV